MDNSNFAVFMEAKIIRAHHKVSMLNLFKAFNVYEISICTDNSKHKKCYVLCIAYNIFKHLISNKSVHFHFSNKILAWEILR